MGSETTGVVFLAKELPKSNDHSTSFLTLKRFPDETFIVELDLLVFLWIGTWLGKTSLPCQTFIIIAFIVVERPILFLVNLLG